MGVTPTRSRRLGLAALSGVIFWSAAAQATTPEAAERRPESVVSSDGGAPAPRAGLPVVGLLADAGIPDGFMAALAVRPIRYLRLHAGAGSNGASPGFRAGLTVLPLGVGPSVTLEAGHYLEGAPGGLVRIFVGRLGRFSRYVNRLDYTFVNAHAGLDLGQRDFTFYLHGGFSYVRAGLRDVTPPADTLSSTGRTSITFHQDPVVRMFAPSVKLGLIVYLQ